MNYIILASGQSSRMGTDKMFIKVGGSSLIARTLGIITSSDKQANIGLIISEQVNRKWNKELEGLMEDFNITLIINKYDNSTTTNSATMCYAVESMNLSDSDRTVVIDSDIFLESIDLENLVSSSSSTLINYATTKTLSPNSKEYSITADGLVDPNCYTGRHILSMYVIRTDLLEQLVKIASHSTQGMSEPYFDNYILRALGWRTAPYYEIIGETQEFDDLEDVINSGKLSVDELLELLEKTHADRDMKGMSNTTYSNDKLFIKIFRGSTSEIVDRTREIDYHRLFHSLNKAPRLVYSNSEYSASERVVGYHPTSPDLIPEIIDSLSSIHTSFIIECTTHCMRVQVEDYKSKCEVGTVTVLEIEELIKLLDTSYENHKCHGDLVPENILVQSDGSIKFIDFEYSCIRNKNWDIATLYLELGEEVPRDKAILSYAVAVDYIWYLWSMMVGKVDQYKEYGFTRLERAKRNYELLKMTSTN